MRIGQLFALLICAAITLGLVATAIWCLLQPRLWIASLIILPFIGIMAWLTRAVWRTYLGIPEPDLLQPDPREPETLVWRGSRARAWGSFVAAGAFAMLAAALLVLCVDVMFAPVLAAGARLAIGLLLALFAVMSGALVSLVWRNGVGFHGARIELAQDALRLTLPRWRSLIHRPPPVRADIPWAEIAAIETREEAYSSQFMAMLQRPYWLVLQNGQKLFLFEDRGIDSPQATRSWEPVARAIAGRPGGKWRELPMAEGRGGILGAWYTSAPTDGAPPITPARTDILRHRVWPTGQVALGAFAIVMLARALAWMLE